jgi:hypothetical protein
MDLFERGQEAIVDAVQQWADAGAKLMPDLSSLPVDDLFPNAEKLVADQFELAEELLAAQRRFAEELLATLRPSTKTD